MKNFFILFEIMSLIHTHKILAILLSLFKIICKQFLKSYAAPIFVMIHLENFVIDDE